MNSQNDFTSLFLIAPRLSGGPRWKMSTSQSPRAHLAHTTSIEAAGTRHRTSSSVTARPVPFLSFLNSPPPPFFEQLLHQIQLHHRLLRLGVWTSAHSSGSPLHVPRSNRAEMHHETNGSDSWLLRKEEDDRYPILLDILSGVVFHGAADVTLSRVLICEFLRILRTCVPTRKEASSYLCQ